MSEYAEEPSRVENDATLVEPSLVDTSEEPAIFEDASTETLSDEEAAAFSAQQVLAEHNALAMAFDEVRAQSAESELTRPSRWIEMGIVPEHLAPEDFEMMVYEYWEDDCAARVEAEAASPKPAPPVFRTATHAVGVPRLFGTNADRNKAEALDEAVVRAEPEVYEESEPVEASATTTGSSETTSLEDAGATPSNTADNPFANLKIPAGYRLVELEGEYVLVEDEQAEPVELVINCEHISALVGAHSYYLYDNKIMTDTYAHWVFLAAEDNSVVTFTDCVREDSRVYPRPLAASSLKNPPFNMDDEGIAQTWTSVQASGEYPDIEQTVASNGDMYFYSTKYLSAPYAASLAEWDAVERRLCL